MKKKQKNQAMPLPLFDLASLQPSPIQASGMSPGDLLRVNITERLEESIQSSNRNERIPLYEDIPASALLEHLNGPQRQAVTTTEGPVLIFAGPGSGKTRVITHRIAYLIKVGGVAPSKILAMTFTNKAADEMRERLERMVGRYAQEITISTFHSLCSRILRRSQDFLLQHGLTPSFTIADDADQVKIIREALHTTGIDISGLEANQQSPGALRDLIARSKGDMESPERLEQRAREENKYSLYIIAQVYRAYNRLLHRQGHLDFEDLLLYCVILLLQNAPDRAYYQKRWTYIHVDEHQDSNYPQYLLVKFLAGGTREQPGGSRNIFVVGDDDQLIYAWRGASIELLESFERDFPEHTAVYLEQNYRSTHTIVQAASAVIQQNTLRRQKQLWTDNEPGPPIRFAALESEDDEAQYVFRTIGELKSAQEIEHWSDVAILYRTNAQSRALEEAALRAGIPYQIVGNTLFYQRKEIKDFLAYLRILINEKDDVSVERIINVPARGIGERTLSSLKEWATQREWSLCEALIHLDQMTGLSRSAHEALSHFADMLTKLRSAASECSLPELLDQVAHLSRMQRALQEGGKDQQERWENVQELRRVASKFTGAETPRALLLFLEHVALMSGADHVETDPAEEASSESARQDKLTLLTLHSAKGTEYTAVFIVGAEEGLIPHSRGLLDEKNEESLSEERRLMYVGLTRAKKILYCVRARRRITNGRLVHTSGSRFLSDIPSQLREILR